MALHNRAPTRHQKVKGIEAVELQSPVSPAVATSPTHRALWLGNRGLRSLLCSGASFASLQAQWNLVESASSTEQQAQPLFGAGKALLYRILHRERRGGPLYKSARHSREGVAFERTHQGRLTTCAFTARENVCQHCFRNLVFFGCGMRLIHGE